MDMKIEELNFIRSQENKARGASNRRRGLTFQSTMIKQLNKVFADTNVRFFNSPLSGAWATKNKTSFLSGDICYENLDYSIFIECKASKHINFANFLIKGKTGIDDHIAELKNKLSRAEFQEKDWKWVLLLSDMKLKGALITQDFFNTLAKNNQHNYNFTFLRGYILLNLDDFFKMLRIEVLKDYETI